MDKQSATKNTVPKVCILGPECTGKTELSKFLADHYKTVWVAEYARAYLNKLGRPYQQADLLKIAHGQLRMEDEWLQDAKKVLICDTNLVVIKIWSEVKYGSCEPHILELMAQRTYNLFLLTYIDVPWENDPMREHPDRREELYQKYLAEMKQQQTPFVEIKGPPETRQKLAVDAIEKLLKN
jgi:NadR type nicotinamide-nucleotide adenylyltransferase